MWPKFKLLFLQSLRIRESWIIFFILGIIMMNFPFISIFNKPALVYHMPLLYLYLMGGWFISILVIYLFTKANHLPKNHHDGRKGVPR